MTGKCANIQTKKLMQVLADISNVNDMCMLLKELMTESEINDLVKRWQLMNELTAGKTQRAIASELGVSLCKITRGAKILKQKNSITKTIITKQKER